MELQALDGLLAVELFVQYFLIGDESHLPVVAGQKRLIKLSF